MYTLNYLNPPVRSEFFGAPKKLGKKADREAALKFDTQTESVYVKMGPKVSFKIRSLPQKIHQISYKVGPQKTSWK